MVDKICDLIIDKMKKEMPDMNEEKSEIIKYGIQLIIGEIPKLFLLFILAFILKIGWLTIFAFFTILPYKIFAGGFHLKTHIGCIVGTLLFYYVNVLISQKIIIQPTYIKYILVAGIWIFGIIMITKYAPADTTNVPILSKKERKIKKTMSYVMISVILIISIFIKDNTLFNIMWIGTLLQTISITRFAYKLTKNEYGYETYMKEAKI